MVKNMLSEVSKPTLTDYSMLKPLYALYKTLYVQDNPRTRKAFIFVILYLYCPVAFVRLRRLNNGLRCRLAREMGCQPTAISHDYREVMFLYEHYKDFRDMTNNIYDNIMQYINEHIGNNEDNRVL